MSISKIILSAVLMSGAIAGHAENLILNGSFEDGKVIGNYGPEPDVMLVSAASGGIPYWNVIAPSGQYIAVLGEKNIAFPAKYGSQFLDLTGVTYNPQGYGVAQSINTVIGTRYTLGFDIGNSTRPGYGAISSVKALVGDATQVFTHMGGDGINSWQHFTMDFVATTATTNISLLSNGGGNYIGLDNVSVMAAVPEPETYGMLLGGLGLISLVARRRKSWVSK